MQSTEDYWPFLLLSHCGPLRALTPPNLHPSLQPKGSVGRCLTGALSPAGRCLAVAWPSLQCCPGERGFPEHAARPDVSYPTGLVTDLCSVQHKWSATSALQKCPRCFPVALMTVTLCIANAEKSTDEAERLFAQIHLKSLRTLGPGEHTAASVAEQKPLPLTLIKGIFIGQTSASASKHWWSEFQAQIHQASHILPFPSHARPFHVPFYPFDHKCKLMGIKAPDVCSLPALALATITSNSSSQG